MKLKHERGGESLMKPKVLITRKIFDEVLTMLKQYFEVEENPSDAPFSPRVLIEKLRDKMGVIIRLTDQISDEVLSQCPDLKS